MTCMADHAPLFPKHLKKQVKNPKSWKKLAKQLASSDRQMNSYLATTQAVDLIEGGVKVNALPEVVTGESPFLRSLSFFCSHRSRSKLISSCHQSPNLVVSRLPSARD